MTQPGDAIASLRTHIQNHLTTATHLVRPFFTNQTLDRSKRCVAMEIERTKWTFLGIGGVDAASAKVRGHQVDVRMEVWISEGSEAQALEDANLVSKRLFTAWDNVLNETGLKLTSTTEAKLLAYDEAFPGWARSVVSFTFTLDEAIA